MCSMFGVNLPKVNRNKKNLDDWNINLFENGKMFSDTSTKARTQVIIYKNDMIVTVSPT